MNPSSHIVKVVRVRDIVRDHLGLGERDYLMNRQGLGIPLRNFFYTWIKENRDPEATLILDFADILESSSSVADELGPILFQEFLFYRETVQNTLGNLYFAYGNLSLELAEALERNFSGWSLSHNLDFPIVGIGLLTLWNGTFQGHRFLGAPQLPSSLIEILDLIYQHNGLTSNELKKLEVKAPSRKLNDIINRCPWLVRQTRIRLEEIEKGWTYVYSPILPPLQPTNGEKLS